MSHIVALATPSKRYLGPGNRNILSTWRVFEQGDWKGIWRWIYGSSRGGQPGAGILKVGWAVRESG
jgi:hypothetical protein